MFDPMTKSVELDDREHLRNPPRQRRSEEKVRAILVAAEEIFAEVGYAPASTTMIAKRADVSVGTVYRLFVDKRAIALTLSDKYFEGVLANLKELGSKITELDQVPGFVSEMLWAGVDLRAFMPGYYAVVAVEGTPDEPAMFDRIRRGQVDLVLSMFSHFIEEIGLSDREAREVVELAVDTIRTALIRLPDEPEEQQLFLSEVDLMLTGYIKQRLGLATLS